MRIAFDLRPKKVLGTLLIVVALLTAASLCGVYLKHVRGDAFFYRFVPQFDLDREGNIPNWFSTILFAASAALLWTIAGAKAKAGDRTRRLWRGLAVFFVLLSIDDAATIHESYVNALRDIFHAGGIFYFSWVIPALALLVLITPFLVRIWLSLAPRIRVVLALSAVLLVGGALGMEMIEGRYVDIWGYKTLTYSLLANVEEVLELLGQVLFIYGLLLIIRAQPEPH